MATAPKQTRRRNNRSSEAQAVAFELAGARSAIDSIEADLASARKEYQQILLKAERMGVAPGLLAETLGTSTQVILNQTKRANSYLVESE